LTVEEIVRFGIIKMIIRTTAHAISQGGSRHSFMNTFSFTFVSVQSISRVASGIRRQDITVGLALSQEVTGSITNHRTDIGSIGINQILDDLLISHFLRSHGRSNIRMSRVEMRSSGNRLRRQGNLRSMNMPRDRRYISRSGEVGNRVSMSSTSSRCLSNLGNLNLSSSSGGLETGGVVVGSNASIVVLGEDMGKTI
jgi:hypothetical protein